MPPPDTTTGAAKGTSGVIAATCSRVNGPVSRERASRVANTTGVFARALTAWTALGQPVDPA